MKFIFGDTDFSVTPTGTATYTLQTFSSVNYFYHSLISLILLTKESYLIELSELSLIGLLFITNYILPQLAMFWLIANTTTLKSTIPNFLAPLFATALVVPFLSQRIDMVIVIGGVLILLGAFLINISK